MADKKSELSAVYLDDMLLLSDREAWTFVKVPLLPYEFLTSETREFLATQISIAVANLVSSNQKRVDVQLRIAHRPFDVVDWATTLEDKVSRQNPTPGWQRYLARMTNHVDALQFTVKEVFLGVKLGDRNTTGDASYNPVTEVMSAMKSLVRKTEELADYREYQVGEKELERWGKEAQNVRRSLAASSLKAKGATADDMAWLIANSFWHGLPQPTRASSDSRPWGQGELRSLVESTVTCKHKWTEVTQVLKDGKEHTGYVAVLSVSRFPDVLHFPEQEPWMHFASSLPFPVDFSTRFTLVPSLQVKKDINKKLADAKDQAIHIAEAGTMVPLQIREQLEVATTLEYTIDRDRNPWAYARHRIIVSGRSPEELAARCNTLIEQYQELGIDVSWPSGDQFQLFKEAIPGDRTRTKAYLQRQEVSVIAGGMPTASSECGDRVEKTGWIGPYLGYTTSRVAMPFMYSPLLAMSRNSPPGVAITGSPGAGKSFLAFTLAYQMALQGVWTIYIDPKADAKPMASLPGLGQPRVFDLRDGNEGMLDPFSLSSERSEATVLALETIRLLLGGSINEDREEALLNAVEQVAQLPNPSLSAVVDVLLANTESAGARNLGAVLRTIRELPFARLCFSPTGGTKLRPEDGLTVVTLLGLELPATGTAPSDYSYENRLAVSVMYLLTRYARQLMLNMNKSHPKAICVDEAWAITSTPQGAKLIPEIARMGRSHNTALVLVSQNAGDLMAESVTNSLSTKFAFRSKIPGEIEDILELFGLDSDEGYQHIIRALGDGECIVQDVDGRIARVQIDAWDAEAFEVFDTNPETRGKKTS